MTTPALERHRSGEERLRELVDRLRSDLYRDKVSTDANAAIEMELHADPKLSRSRIAELANIGETTLRGWKTGRSSPTLDTVEKVVSALHPEGPLSDYLAWLRAGRDWLIGKEQELEAYRLERRRQEIQAAARAQVDDANAAQAIVAFLEEQPAEIREEIVRRLAKRSRLTLTELLADDEREETHEP